MSETKPSTSGSAPQSATPEASLEEIIASISRIIAEDNRTAPSARAYSRPKSGILELTEAIEADGTIRQLASAGPASSRGGSEPVPAPLPHPPPHGGEGGGLAASSAPAATNPPTAGDARLSAAAFGAATAAFARLGTVAAELRSPALGVAGPTLEDIVRDALRPLLRAWLDTHLTEIVERLVQAEIRRVVDAARSR